VKALCLADNYLLAMSSEEGGRGKKKGWKGKRESKERHREREGGRSSQVSLLMRAQISSGRHHPNELIKHKHFSQSSSPKL
jgi:hypothetical protein